MASHCESIVLSSHIKRQVLYYRKGKTMPIITMDGPPVADNTKKRTMIEAITRATADFYNLPPETIIILIKENRAENVAVGGTLISDRPKS